MATDNQPGPVLGGGKPAHSPLRLSLTLARQSIIRGESVPFTLSLANSGGAAIGSVKTFSPDNEATSLFATPRGSGPRERIEGGVRWAEPPAGQVHGDPNSIKAREGVHVHGSTFTETTELGPGQSITHTGDVLQWLGELEQGVWELHAEHNIGDLTPARSEVVLLEIKPAEATRVESVGSSLRTGLAPVLSAWRHEPGGIVFHQVLSPKLPRAAYRCVRIGEGIADAPVHPSTMADAGNWSPHIVMRTGDDLVAVKIDPKTGAPAGRGGIAGINGRNVVVGSPLSLSDGRLLFVATDAKRSGLTLFEVAQDFTATAHEIKTEGGIGVDPSVVWDFERAVRVAWADSRRRQAFIAEASLVDPASGFRVRPMYTSPGPIASIHLHTVQGVFLGEYEPGTPTEQIQAPPSQTSFWCVYEDRVNEGKSDEQVLWRGAYGSAALPGAGVTGSVEVTGLADPRVISRRLTANGGLVMLIADSGGQLHYADMSAGSLKPVRPLAGMPVTTAMRPELVTSQSAGPAWVYLRWIDREGGRLAWAKLAPAEFDEPDQHGHSH